MWTKYNIEKDKVYFWQFGVTEFWVKKLDKKWLVAYRNSKVSSKQIIKAKMVEEPVDIEFQTCIGDRGNTLNVVPSLPKLPVVLRPFNSYKVLPKTTAHIYVHIPVSINLYAGSVKDENLLAEIPGEELSNTWFGAPDSGELAVAVKNNFYSDADNTHFKVNDVMCPVRITNDAETSLDFQRMLLHVEYVAIYSSNQKLYTNEIKVKFKGESAVSDINYSSQSPSFLEGAKQVAAARNPDKFNVLKRTFYFIKSLTEN